MRRGHCQNNLGPDSLSLFVNMRAGNIYPYEFLMRGKKMRCTGNMWDLQFFFHLDQGWVMYSSWAKSGTWPVFVQLAS